MSAISRELLEEIDKRVAEGPYASAEELLRQALLSLDREVASFDAWLEHEILRGIGGESMEMTEELLDNLFEEALAQAHVKKFP